jgi:protein involved in polysaccharide export with SLBB domain
LIQAIGVAGGYSRLAAPSRVTVKRVTDGREAVFKLDAKRMASDSITKAFEIAPGDIITIGERLF